MLAGNTKPHCKRHKTEASTHRTTGGARQGVKGYSLFYYSKIIIFYLENIMTKERFEKAVKKVQFFGETYLTVCGLREVIPGRLEGTRVSVGQILRYVKEGCPCFNHSGRHLFQPEKVKKWLEERQTEKQIKRRAKTAKLRQMYD